jgi:hypothetical protein
MSDNMIDNKHDNDIQQIDENYQMPVEQETDVIDELVNKKLPTDINKWFFVVIISGITTIFGILMKLQDDRLTDSEKNATEWKANANEWKQAYSSVHNLPYQKTITDIPFSTKQRAKLSFSQQ